MLLAFKCGGKLFRVIFAIFINKVHLDMSYSLCGFSVTPSFLFRGSEYAHKKAWELLVRIPIQGCLA